MMFSWILIVCILHLSESCLNTPAEYTDHLEMILADSSTPVQQVCSGVRLGTRTQVLSNEYDPDTLNKRGIFWTFGTGEEVADDWIVFAKEADGDREEFAKRVLHHVGFADSDINYDSRFHMVVFDYDKLDVTWNEVDAEQKSFKPTWNTTFEYLGNGFEVCRNPGADLYPDGSNISGPEDCEFKIVDISLAARDWIMSRSWEEVTGCPGGYPDHAERVVDFASCMDDCQGQSSAAQYCQFVDTITPISYGGSIVCCDQYESAKPSQLSTAEEALWARVWFEKCMAMNRWFTGEGYGYDPTVQNKTGTEYIVRGDVDLQILGPADGIDLF